MLGGRDTLHKDVSSIEDFYDWSQKIVLAGLYDKLEPDYLDSLSSLRLQNPMLVQTRKKSKSFFLVFVCLFI